MKAFNGVDPKKQIGMRKPTCGRPHCKIPGRNTLTIHDLQ